MKKTFMWVLCFSFTALLVACGEQDDGKARSSAGGNNESYSYGQFIDAPVEGLAFTCGTISGTTDADGTFKYLNGQKVTFKVGDIILGSATGQGIVTPLDLARNERNDQTVSASDQMVVNIVRFLLTITNSTEASTKLTIDSATDSNCKGKSLVFDQPTASFAMPAGITTMPLVDATTAAAHMQSALDAVQEISLKTVTDPATGLMWQKADDNAKRNWHDAVGYCEDLSVGIYDNWILPSREQLQGLNISSIYDQIEGTHYAQVGESYIGSYWSSTGYGEGQAYHVFLTSNGAEGRASKGYTNLVRCVRRAAPPTVIDPATNLVWQKADDNIKRNWNDAAAYCDDAAIGGYSDWRLPSMDELNSLNSASIFEQIEGTHYAEVDGQYLGAYWSSTSYNNDEAYHVFLRQNASSSGRANKSGWTNLVRCVRP